MFIFIPMSGPMWSMMSASLMWCHQGLKLGLTKFELGLLSATKNYCVKWCATKNYVSHQEYLQISNIVVFNSAPSSNKCIYTAHFHQVKQAGHEN